MIKCNIHNLWDKITPLHCYCSVEVISASTTYSKLFSRNCLNWSVMKRHNTLPDLHTVIKSY